MFSYVFMGHSYEFMSFATLKGLHWTGAAACGPGPAFREHALAAAGCEPIEAEGAAWRSA